MDKAVTHVGRPFTAIYETTRYDVFKRMEANRVVDESRVSHLVESFSEKELINPILVNENYEIVDGQGRYEACKRLGIPIKYVVQPGATIDDCRRMNKFNSKWDMKDWIDSYCENNDPNVAQSYRTFRECAEETGMPYSRLLRLSGHGTHPREGKFSIIADGRLVFTKEDAEKVKRLQAQGQDILFALAFTKRTNDVFWNAVYVIDSHPRYNHERMVEKCKACRNSYGQYANLDDQLKEFTRIYNNKVQTGKNKIFFEDYMRNKGYNVRDYDFTPSYKDKTDISTLKW